jgi:hypothetical protein
MPYLTDFVEEQCTRLTEQHLADRHATLEGKETKNNIRVMHRSGMSEQSQAEGCHALDGLWLL